MLYQIISNIADKVELFIDAELTVGEVRVLVQEMIGAGERVMRLTFQGHVLDDDKATWEMILAMYPLIENTPRKIFVHVSDKERVESASIEALRAALPSSMTNSEEEKAARRQAQLMEPMIDAMVENPEFLNMLISSQPQLKRMMDSHPEMAHVFRDSSTLKSIMMSQIDPDQKRSLSRDLQLQLAQISAIPGGEQLLEHHTSKYLAELDADFGNISKESAGDVDEEQARPDPGKEANSEALPNPWEQQQQQQRDTEFNSEGISMNHNNSLNYLLGSFGGRNSGGVNSGNNSSDNDNFINLLASMAGSGGFGRNNNNNNNGNSGGIPGIGGNFMPFLGLPSSTPSNNSNNPFSPEALMSAFMAQPPTSVSHNSSTLTGANIPPSSTSSTSAAVNNNPLMIREESGSDRVRWASQIAILKDMGFEDEALCIEALRATNGDVDMAVNFIVNRYN